MSNDSKLSDIEEYSDDSNLTRGIDVIREFMQSLSENSGVYQMLDFKGRVLYVGKAKNLKKRVSSYTRVNNQSLRIKRMIFQTASMRYTETVNEVEALLLEASLIKSLKPRYNILLRDDKSFPSIVIRKDHDYPQILKHRGKKNSSDEYFGPYADGNSVNKSLELLEKIFYLRSCSDSKFNGRKKACILYQIKRCSAPCVGLISKEEYGSLVRQARDFLRGKTNDLQKDLAILMEQASEKLQFEQALICRDRIAALTKIQMGQRMNLSSKLNADVFVMYEEKNKICIEIMFIRYGNNMGTFSNFIDYEEGDDIDRILVSFLLQFYNRRDGVEKIILNKDISDKDILESALNMDRMGKDFSSGVSIKKLERPKGLKTKISIATTREELRIVNFVMENAKRSLKNYLYRGENQRLHFDNLRKLLDMNHLPKRIEVYDNSHIQGKYAVGTMIVVKLQGYDRKGYRKFKIKGANSTKESSGEGYSAGDDLGMMREVLTRRLKYLSYSSVQDRGMGERPDIIIVDGGKTQLKVAQDVLSGLGLTEGIKLLGIAKGERRNAGEESILIDGREPIKLQSKNNELLYFLQRIRDEAHRFAIGTHRSRRDKDTFKNPLDGIKSIGVRRKRMLMNHFGSARRVMEANVRDLLQVEGISQRTAQIIYNYFHEI